MRHDQWQAMTMLSAICLDGVIRQASVLVNGPLECVDVLGLYVAAPVFNGAAWWIGGDGQSLEPESLGGVRVD